MKLFSTFGLIAILFGCGILSMVFGLPERYVERDVTAGEVIGKWNITSESEAEVKDFVSTFPDWGADAPWKTIALYEDGSCTVILESDWLGGSHSQNVNVGDVVSCSWNLTKAKNLRGKVSPVLDLQLNFPDNYSMMFSLCFYEENGKLILWDFIGDPDDFQTQDFVKSDQ